MSESVSSPASSSAECSRPRGQKQAKLAEASNKTLAAASLVMADSGRELAEVAKAKLKDSIQRTAVFKQMVTHSIMSVDLEKMSNVAKEYYHLEQKRILDEIRRAADEDGTKTKQTVPPVDLNIDSDPDDNNVLVQSHAQLSTDSDLDDGKVDMLVHQGNTEAAVDMEQEYTDEIWIEEELFSSDKSDESEI